jgi:GT2 family glycosyltransferase
METSESPSGPGLLEPFEPVVTAPPVVAIVVTNNAGPWLEATIASLAAQDYPAFSVLVLDNASAENPTPRIAAVMPHAYVRRLERDDGFPTAANHALDTVEGATFLLFCHDDVVLEPDAVRVMVEEAYRSNAGIVGPKLVDADHPDVLLEVGMAIDHYGVPFSAIEPNEVDQEQHDAVRDVFFVSHAAMLVRADLFGELHGFDAATFPGSDDIDLCWRARLAGARVLVAPDARVRHRRVGARDERVVEGTPASVTRAATRGRVRVLMKSYSALALLWVLPTAFLLNLVEAIGLVFGRQRGRARGLIGGWWANLRQLRDVRRARRDAQALRRVDDGDVRDLMVRGSARLRTLFTQRLHAGDRIHDVSDHAREVVERTGDRLRRPGAIGALVVIVMVVLGSRNLLFDRVPEIGTLRVWPGLGDLARTFTSPWQRSGLGVAAPVTPAFGFMALWSTVLLGNTHLARALVVVGAIPLGAFCMYRAARPLARSALPALAAGAAYAANPLPRNAISQGRFGSLVAYALAPFLLILLLRASGSAGIGEDSYARTPPWRGVLGAALLLALIAAFFPAGVFFALAIGVAFLLAGPLVGGGRGSALVFVAAVTVTAVAALLLVPWTFAWFLGDGASLGFLARDPIGLGAILRFNTGPAGAGWAPYGLLVAAALPLFVASGARLRWAARAWLLVAVSYALAWLPGRLDASLARPEPEGVLVGAALGLALATGLGVAAFADDLRQFLFGWRQVAAVAAAFGLLFPLVGMFGDSIAGRWRAPSRDWADAVSWMHDERRHGDFRVLWLGDADVLPLAARTSHDTGYGFTSNGSGDVRNSFAAPAGDGEDVADDAIGLLANQQTARFGHLVAPMGVRYVALVRRAAPSGGATRPFDPAISASLGEQLDLAIVQSEPDMLLYENKAWASTRALAPASTPIAATRDGATEASLRAELERAVPVHGAMRSSELPKAGTFLFGEAYDGRWKATVDGKDLPHRRAFGWSNAYTASGRGTADLRFHGGVTRPLLLLLETLVWVACAIALFGGRRRRAGART